MKTGQIIKTWKDSALIYKEAPERAAKAPGKVIVQGKQPQTEQTQAEQCEVGKCNVEGFVADEWYRENFKGE